MYLSTKESSILVETIICHFILLFVNFWFQNYMSETASYIASLVHFFVKKN